MEIITDIAQGDPEWFALRLGSIGGSGIKKATAKGTGKTRTDYLYKKTDEILTGRMIPSYQNEAMQLGHDSESLSRNAYAFITDVEVEQITMIKHSAHKHYSADGLVGKEGIIEIKNTNGPNFLRILDQDKVPAEHAKQIQWGLALSGRSWCDYVQACWIREDEAIVPRYPDTPIWIRRVYPDETLIRDLMAETDRFIDEMLATVEKMKQKAA